MLILLKIFLLLATTLFLLASFGKDKVVIKLAFIITFIIMMFLTTYAYTTF